MKVLVVVDMQNDFIDGALGTPEAQTIVQNVINKMKEYENENSIVFFTQDTHNKKYLETQEGKFLPIEHCIEGTYGWEIADSIKNEFQNGNYTLKKEDKGFKGNVYCKEGFGATGFFAWESNTYLKHAESIEFVGLCTDICVVSNALVAKSFFQEVPIIVDASCCAGTTPEAHQAALTTMKSCQIKII